MPSKSADCVDLEPVQTQRGDAAPPRNPAWQGVQQGIVCLKAKEPGAQKEESTVGERDEEADDEPVSAEEEALAESTVNPPKR